jgi:hypothetical protein
MKLLCAKILCIRIEPVVVLLNKVLKDRCENRFVKINCFVIIVTQTASSQYDLLPVAGKSIVIVDFIVFLIRLLQYMAKQVWQTISINNDCCLHESSLSLFATIKICNVFHRCCVF